MSKDKSGFIIAAAFIGPGTVTTASLAGAQFGFHLVWALLFSVVATMILQDMAARLGIGTGQSLAHCLVSLTDNRFVKKISIVLIISAIGIGNAAYESGNLTGAAIGLHSIAPIGVSVWAGLLGLIAAALLYSGKYKLIESVLVSLVGLMALVFVVTLIVARPDFATMTAQLFAPRFDAHTTTMVLALIGTTIVPYNLFLHASLVAQAYRGQNQAIAIRACRRQSAFAIGFGGFITLVIVATAMTAFFGQAMALSAANMSEQLAPVLGDKATWFFGAGMLAAGLTSAITAPLAAAYAICGALGKPADLHTPFFKTIWGLVIATGIIVASAGFKPLSAIVFAQAANALLLPVVAVFLLAVMNQKTVPAAYRNTPVSNLFGGLTVAFILGLAGNKMLQLFTG
ncbi:Nramp family divalent metal transporter [Aestuariibacter sp. A3R04]|uniref:Nramp family divalent metal transporter n=1 Tax=Aestuariibacter sp. A3R04 TaxID=2841571 RepID=UPI001C0A51DA|nr:Nramp family divalent metal transporter [Aestuariibacter sp. A3R04]MBU3021425.1 Nramp family divalent metal transporter [Aestuariibacter sp. A3R04]